MKISAIWRILSLAMVAAGCLGCGGGAPAEQLVTVSGTVKLDGKPLEGATLAFIPAKSKQVQPSWAYTDAEGKYSLKTAEGKTGVQLGEYRIVVSKLVMQDGSPIPPGSQTGGADGLELVPAPHNDPRETKNVAVVTKEGEVFDVDIASPTMRKGAAKTKAK